MTDASLISLIPLPFLGTALALAALAATALAA